MNNRIEELLSAAKEHADGIYRSMQEEPPGDFDVWYHNKIHEKFAEFIVKECLDACDENNKSYYAHVGIAACVKSIKQRFGVE